MADPEGNYGGSSSGYVQYVRFPRTDFGTWAAQDTSLIPPPPPIVGIGAIVAFQGGSLRVGQTWVWAFDATTGFVAPVVAEWDPSIAGSWAHGERTRARGWWVGDAIQIGWWSPTLPVPFDPALYGPNAQLAASFRTGQTWVLSSESGLAFLGTPDVAGFDPALVVPAIQQANLRSWRRDVATWEFEDVETFGVPIPYLPQTEQSLRSFRSAAREWWIGDASQVGWWVSTFPVTWDPSIAGSWLHGERTRGRRWWTADPVEQGYLSSVPGLGGSWLHGDRTRARRWWTSDPIPDAWAFSVVPFDPSAFALQAWSHGDRMRGRKWWTTDFVTPVVVPVPIFDPQLWSAVSLYGARTPARKWWTSEPVESGYLASAPGISGSWQFGDRMSDRNRRVPPSEQIGWWALVLPTPFDPALYAPNVQLASSVRIGQTWTLASENGLAFLATPDAVAPWDPSVAGSWQFGDRTRARRWWTSTPLPIGWWAPTLPAFDPALYVAAIQQIDTRVGWRRDVATWEFEDVETFGVPIPYLAQIEQLLRSYRLVARRWWTSTPSQDAWIYLAIPPWNPSVAGSWGYGDRMRSRLRWASEPPQIGWWAPTLPVVEEAAFIKRNIYHYKHHH
jgi:hypothetical protein